MKKELSKQAVALGSTEYLKLFNYIIGIPNGTLLEYSQVEIDTGIKMDYLNRSKLHRACVASGREYLTVKNVGYQLADGSNAIGIVNTGIHKVGNSISRLRRTHVNIKIDIYEEMTPDDKRSFLQTESITSTINQSIENSMKPRTQLRQLNECKPILPE